MVDVKDILHTPKPTIPEPLPLESAFPPVEVLSQDMLPAPLVDYVFDIADRSQCPVEYVAVSVLVALGSLLGSKYAIRPKQHDNWEIYPNLWGALIGPPSAMKSPAMKDALKPLVLLERSLTESNASHKKKELLIGELEKALARKKQKEAEGLYEQGLTDEALSIMGADAPSTNGKGISHRLIVNDTTVEKLGELLNENPNGLLLSRDELHGFLARLAREDGQADRAFYLECFDGNGRFTYDRIGRGTIVIERCMLSILGGIQPSKIAEIIRMAMTGKSDDGLIQRLQLAVWPDSSSSKVWRDSAPNQCAQEKYYRLIETFHQLKGEEDAPRYLKFSPEAQVLFTAWWCDLQAEINNDDIHPVVQSHFGKYPKTIGALALIFELCSGGREHVGTVATQLALQWAALLRSHALRLYSAYDNSSNEGAKRLLARQDKFTGNFTLRDVRRKGWAGLKESPDIQAALNRLVDHYYLIEIHLGSGPQGGRPTVEYRWNPAIRNGEIP